MQIELAVVRAEPAARAWASHFASYLMEVTTGLGHGLRMLCLPIFLGSKEIHDGSIPWC